MRTDAISQSEFKAILCSLRQARENPHMRVAISFGFASHWLRKFCNVFLSILKRNKANKNNIVKVRTRVENPWILGVRFQGLESTWTLVVVVRLFVCFFAGGGVHSQSCLVTFACMYVEPQVHRACLYVFMLSFLKRSRLNFEIGCWKVLEKVCELFY